MRNVAVKNFKYGVINNIEAQSIPDGAASDSLSWLTKGDRIELCRGSKVIGTEQAGTGNVAGLFVAHRADGTAIKYEKRGRKLFYYNSATGDWVEVGTDLFPAAAENDAVLFAEYQSLAGAQLWFSSPNSSLYKIMTANPESYADMYNASKNFKGYIRIKLNRMMLWGRNEDKTGVYGSKIDTQTFTTVSSESAGTGNGVQTTFTGTAAFKAGGAKRTSFAYSVNGGSETFTDDFNGNLVGSAGGTGTINYMTGAYSITFNAAPANLQAITISYQWEDSTNGGIADFTKSATRLAGEGFIFRQDDGGEIMNIESYGDVEYCLHKYKTWALTITATDTNASNLIYRDKVGIPYLRASVSTDSGIYHINVTDENRPRFCRLRTASGSTSVEPEDVTLNLNLEGYYFDKCEMEEWNEYVVFTGRTKDSSVNNRFFLYNKTWESIDIRDYYLDVIAIDGGILIGGESISQNVVTLFSGYDDDDALINNYWIGSITNLGIDDRLKKVRRLVLQGLIQSGQIIDVYLRADYGNFVKVGEISGSGTYVDKGQSVSIGALTVGSSEVGGGGDGQLAYNYVRELSVNLDRFDELQIKLVATGIGYASVSKIVYQDIRLRSARIPLKYRQ